MEFYHILKNFSKRDALVNMACSEYYRCNNREQKILHEYPSTLSAHILFIFSVTHTP
jgi:hypothetical protein